jgi:hypothetical protein
MHDEALRAYFSISINRSPSGDRVWEENVIPGTIARSPKLQSDMVRRMKKVCVATATGIDFLPAIEVPDERIEKFLVRVTKGMLRHFYPEYEYQHDDFSVRLISPINERKLRSLDKFIMATKYEERGGDVLRFRHGITDTGLSGVWLYIFYDSVWYLVFHTHKETDEPAPV